MSKEKKKKRMSRGILLRTWGGANIGTGLAAGAIRHHVFKRKGVPGAGYDYMDSAKGKNLGVKLRHLYKFSQGMGRKPSIYRRLIEGSASEIGNMPGVLKTAIARNLTFKAAKAIRKGLGQQAILGTALGAGAYAWGRHKAKKRKKELGIK